MAITNTRDSVIVQELKEVFVSVIVFSRSFPILSLFIVQIVYSELMKFLKVTQKPRLSLGKGLVCS